ncbi:outer membrane protein [Methylosinus sp. LW4]|uniref:outer membrane protein n=1 Tax=Methylosinus sp. LW4 TaxID=136993 RepID=UPI000382577D|nr:outer membrane beta-barrel protein [Methylosinus sp. LW4]
MKVKRSEGRCARFRGEARRRLAFALIAGFPFALSPAKAGPPFLTDDPEPVEYGHYEFYVFSQGARAGGETSGVAPACDCNFGVLPNVQFHVQPGMAFRRPGGGDLFWGAGDVELGVKYRFLEQDKDGAAPSAAFYPLIETPTGDASRGLSGGRARVFLPVWLQKDFGDWSTFGGGGYWINPGPGARNFGFLGWALLRKIDERLTLGAEIFHQTPSEVGAAATTGFNVGAIYDLSPRYHLLASLGRALTRPKETGQFTWYLGFQVTDGEEASKSASEAPRSSATVDWSGFHAGLSLGGLFRRTGETLVVGYSATPDAPSGSRGAALGGFAGYDAQLGSAVLGVETDVEAGSVSGATFGSRGGARLRNDARASLRGRVGLARDRGLFYATGGLTVADVSATAMGEPFDRAQTGWTIGGGVEYALADHWSGRVEYRHGRPGEIAFASSSFDGNLYRIRLKEETIRLALAYRFGLDAPEEKEGN